MPISIVQPPNFFAIYPRETVFSIFFYAYMLISEASAKYSYFIKAAVRGVIEKCRRGVKKKHTWNEYDLLVLTTSLPLTSDFQEHVENATFC